MKTLQIFALILALTTACAAKDAIQASVSGVNSDAIVVANGNPYAAGTYAIGTIQLWYTVNNYQFPVGPFGSFTVGLTDAAYKGSPETSYGSVKLNLTQIGSKDIQLSPAPASFAPTGPGWTGSSLVSIAIAPSVASDLSLNKDGAELVANLKMDTSPSGAHLDTITNIQVHIKLVHPTTCLKVYDFITDEGLTTPVSFTQVNVSGGKNPKITSTNPFGQFSDNVLVVNTCSIAQTFSLKTILDAVFETNPHNNPGNAVFTYFKTGYADPAAFSIASFGAGTPQGEQLCLSGITVPANSTFLETVHMQIDKGMSPASLPSTGTFKFSAAFSSGTGCTGVPILATPNPAATIGFSLQ